MAEAPRPGRPGFDLAYAFLRKVGALPPPPLVGAGLVLSICLSSLCVILIGQGLKTWTGGGAAGGLSVLGYAALVALLAGSSALRVYLATIIGDHIGARIRIAVFSSLVARPLSFFEQKPSGEMLSLIIADAGAVQAVVRTSLTPLIRNALVAAGAGAMMFATSWRLSLLAACAAPAPLLAGLVLNRRHKALSRAVADRVGDLAAQADEALAAIATIKTLNREEMEVGRFSASVEAARRVSCRLAASRATLLFLVILLGLLALGLVLWAGHAEVVRGGLRPAAFASFLFFLLLAAGAAASLGNLWSATVDAVVALERLAQHAAPVDAPAAQPFAADPARPPFQTLRLEGVSFRYPSRPETLALDDVSFEVSAGETVALVGASGAGKSTVLRLLLGFDRPERGHILIDGEDVAGMEPRRLKSWFAVTPQAPFIFSATLADNIRYGRLDASDEEVAAAARAAAIQRFAQTLPEGLGTFLGERGARLSGGQRQRVAIARAILRDAPILLLDEATSAVDAITESDIKQALGAGAGARATLVIAHKLSTVLEADRIVVLHHGRVEAVGAHADLMRRSAVYRGLAQLQLEAGTPYAEPRE